MHRHKQLVLAARRRRRSRCNKLDDGPLLRTYKPKPATKPTRTGAKMPGRERRRHLRQMSAAEMVACQNLEFYVSCFSTDELTTLLRQLSIEDLFVLLETTHRRVRRVTCELLAHYYFARDDHERTRLLTRLSTARELRRLRQIELTLPVITPRRLDADRAVPHASPGVIEAWRFQIDAQE